LHPTWQPTFYCAVNPFVQEQFLEEALQRLDETELFFVSPEFAALHNDERIVPIVSLPIPTFSRMPEKGVHEGWTVTYVCMQLAFWMGFQEWLLVGLDHRYVVPDGTTPNQPLRMTHPDPNHFAPEYFENAKWHAPDLRHSEKSYQMALEVATAEGIEIWNLTPNTALDIFPKGELEKWRSYLH